MAKGVITRERILEQALRDASLVGLDGLSLGKLADEVEMSKSGIFAHFGSKEELQKQVLAAAAEKFGEIVVKPALTAPRGIPRVRAMFEGWLRWERDVSVPGGCVFTHAAVELDDRPGPVRDDLAVWQRTWRDMLARAASIAVDEKQFRKDLDTQQFAFRLMGIIFVYYNSKRLLEDPKAEAHTRAAFEDLVEWASA
ncbi:MAG TPA: TetR/AcrR family transcriptional regulator [Gemmatimonadales bacterium]|nr:TetR/AcrR family transcriptional regulator [Gemmatimonadales bacterium]